MTFLNNLLHNDYVFIPLYVGMAGVIGWAWWSEGTRIFSKASPTSSWDAYWSDKVTNASEIEQQTTQQQLLKLQNSTDSEETILRALNETRESTSAILSKLEEIRQIRAGTSQISSAFDPSLMIPQTPTSVETAVEIAGHISRNTEAMAGAAGFFINSGGSLF